MDAVINHSDPGAVPGASTIRGWGGRDKGRIEPVRCWGGMSLFAIKPFIALLLPVP